MSSKSISNVKILFAIYRFFNFGLVQTGHSLDILFVTIFVAVEAATEGSIDYSMLKELPLER